MTSQPAATRQSTGIPRLDQALGGGLIPGTLTVVMGATGIGKTQLGVSYAFAGQQQEQQTGILFDLTTRGDSQNQPEYAERMFGWKFRTRTTADHLDPAVVWERDQIRSDYLHAFHRGGRRVTIGDMVMLDDLISRPIQSGDVLSNANTILPMGKTRNGDQMGRAIYVVKHRGSACEESILPYRITERGIEF